MGGGILSTTQRAFEHQLCVVGTPAVSSGFVKGAMLGRETVEGSLWREMEVIYRCPWTNPICHLPL